MIRESFVTILAVIAVTRKYRILIILYAKFERAYILKTMKLYENISLRY